MHCSSAWLWRWCCKGGHQINDADDLLWRDGCGKWFRGKRLANPKEERKLSNDERIAESYGRLAAQELSDKIGRTCRIVSGRKKGRIELDYYGIDDLNDLLEALAAIKRRKDGSEKE